LLPTDDWAVRREDPDWVEIRFGLLRLVMRSPRMRGEVQSIAAALRPEEDGEDYGSRHLRRDIRSRGDRATSSELGS
jgi:hypothetical protein